MTYSELKKLLKDNGCYFHHDGKQFPVGRHKTEEVKKGTLKSIKTDAGIE